MLLTGEVKDKDYQEPLRQQEAVYAHSSDQYLKADAETGKHYYDLNAASKSYAGPWLFGKEDVSVMVGRLKANWQQWCPVPADVRDGVFMKGNVVYENPDGSYRMSTDLFEGEIRTEGGRRYFVGRTQHTFYGRDLPDGQLKVIADLQIDLAQRLSHNPMMVSPQQQAEMVNYSQPANYSQPNYAQQPRYPQPQQQPIFSRQNYPQQRGYEQPAAPQQYNAQPEIRF